MKDSRTFTPRRAYRYDYEEVESEAAAKVFAYLNASIADGTLATGAAFGTYEVALADNFEYTDPIDGSVSKNQGLRIVLKDGSRIIFRLSGTGSAGATIRLYVEKYVVTGYDASTSDAIKDLIALALEASKLFEFTGRKEPTVIT
ncbi:alpha-D-phosphohexomutase [Blyttiomyces helicus]|uniref:Alpha-D-phosphohexomutase n=1 Tax=Blyttiomyces helicus TaxID=388810 RepID=A0A4P9W0D4_9FUNG|nr:alpha-D-phosphohexomutase [Blyttiomyces helicus]|eukprot:RKO83476.1 alpha-D-phosphohexomutase [Blyttiomyces helicus]